MKKMLLVWKSDDYRNVRFFIRPYAINSKKHEWFNDVEVLIWGAATDFCKENQEAQDIIKEMVTSNITVRACKYCADQVAASEILKVLGVDVMYTGVFLSDKMKDPEYEVITI